MNVFRHDGEAAMTALSERVEEHAARYRAESEAGFCSELTARLAGEWERCHLDFVAWLRQADLLPKAASGEREALTRVADRVRAWFGADDDRTALIEQLLERERSIASEIDTALDAVPGESAAAVLREARACSTRARQALEDARSARD